MKTTAANLPYGYQELRLIHQRYMSLAMLIAVTIQMLIIGGYHISNWVGHDSFVPESGQTGGVRDSLRIICVHPIPPIDLTGGSRLVSVASKNFEYGTIIPVPDLYLKEEKLFPTQGEVSKLMTDAYNQWGDGSGTGTTAVDPSESLIPKNLWEVEREPVAIISPKPEYPDLAMRANIEGAAVVKVLLDNKGRVKEAVLVKASEDMFARPALEAARQWVFTPALMNGNPVPVWMSIPFRFRLLKNEGK